MTNKTYDRIHSGFLRFGPLQTLGFFICVYNWGWFYGLTILILTFLVISEILWRFFKIEIASVGDFLFKYYENVASMNCVFTFELDPIKFEELVNTVYEKSLKNVPRCYSNLKFYGGFMLFVPKG